VDFTLRNNRGFNVLHHAALKGNHYAIERLLSTARQLVDVKKDDGFSALHLACLNGHYGVTKALVEEGQADIEIRNNRKQTPLHLAVSQGYCGIVEFLIGQGAVVSPEDEDSDTPLHVILTKHFDDSQAEEPHPTTPGTGPILNPVTVIELRKHENAPQIAAVSQSNPFKPSSIYYSCPHKYSDFYGNTRSSCHAMIKDFDSFQLNLDLESFGDVRLGCE